MPRSNEIYENKAYEWKNFLRNSKFEIRSMPTIGWILIYNFHKIYMSSATRVIIISEEGKNPFSLYL